MNWKHAIIKIKKEIKKEKKQRKEGGEWTEIVDRREGELEIIIMPLDFYCETSEICSLYIIKYFKI